MTGRHRLYAVFILVLITLLVGAAHAATIITCRIEPGESAVIIYHPSTPPTMMAYGVRLNGYEIGARPGVIVSDPMGACRVSIYAFSIYLICYPKPIGYSVSIVVPDEGGELYYEGAKPIGYSASTVASDEGGELYYEGATCTVITSKSLYELTAEAISMTNEIVANTESFTTAGDWLVGIVPGGLTTLALMTLAFVAISTRSPAMSAGTALLLSPFLPRWIAASILVGAAAWLLYSAWKRS